MKGCKAIKDNDMKVLMVCLGNICRSPLAHGIMQDVATKYNVDWEVESAGTGDWHIGNPPDHRSIAVAKKYGLDISGQRAQQFHKDFFEEYDLIFVMDKQNYLDVISLAENEEERAKVKLFLEEDEVPDPYTDDALFEPVYHMIADRCEAIIKEKLDELS